MRDRDRYRHRGFYRIDDRTGFRVHADRTMKEWDGTIVAREDFETRHPQDFVRGRRDDVRVPDPRPDPEPINQAPAGGPFILIVSNGDDVPCIQIEGGEIRVLAGTTQLSASDL